MVVRPARRWRPVGPPLPGPAAAARGPPHRTWAACPPPAVPQRVTGSGRPAAGTSGAGVAQMAAQRPHEPAAWTAAVDLHRLPQPDIRTAADLHRPPQAAGRTAAADVRRPRQPDGADGRTAMPADRRSGRSKPSHRALIGLLLAPVLIVILVVAVIVYRGSRPVPTTGHDAAAASKPAVTPTTAPTLGPWRDITSQAVDTQPLSIRELYPARFSAGGSAGTRTVQRANTKCTNAVIGTALKAAVRKGGCTQVMRASYLSTNRKMMATIGVLNLVDVAAAEKAGKAAGSSEFIRQLPGRHGPTRNLTKGTGLVTAEVKGHYLILIWTEFANQHAPSGKKQRKELTRFSADLFAGTANVSLTSRMVTGKPVNR
jgi:hypothetical protein